MTHAIKAAVIATSVSCTLLTSTPSRACGGCFGPPSFSSTSTVTGHRMAFAVSPDRTVLWDSFEYTGAPEDFSWVLPVLPGAVLEESTDAWFEALETATQTTVTSPTLTCASSSSSGGFGCGASSADSSFAAGDTRGFVPGDRVQVLHEGTVGPYETVTLRSTDANALTTWLTMHGYAIPADIQPTIDDYTAQGNDFIALRLQPGVSVQKMTPVRVVTPSGDYLLPLRMVAAGVGEHVNIVLYLIGEQRYAMPDLHEVSVDPQQLTWTFANNTSNYPELRRQALAKNLGFSYLPTFAMQQGFSKPIQGPNGPLSFTIQKGTEFASFSTIADLYFGQANANDNLSLTSCPTFSSRLSSSALVTEDGTGSTIPKSNLNCGDYTDISAAMLGMHPSKVWLTRLELDLPKEALSTDCTVVAAESQTEVSNQLQATHAPDRPAGCQEVVFESRIARSSPKGGTLMVLALMGGFLWLRRRFGGAC